MSITDRNDLVGIIGKSYQDKTIIRWILERMGTMIWMDRETIDFEAIRNALHHLRQGLVVGIAPEGTRSRESKSLMEGKQGAALLAARASVRILPVGIAGSEKIMGELLKLRRPTVNIRVGKVYTLPEMDMNDRQGWLQRSTDEIMCRIAAQLPPQYRGYYAEHPRLQALLREDEVG
jgi:1-acyl-sn-glycerol-3-phosphate acyltransferase